MRVLATLTAVLLAFQPTLAMAHAHLVKSDPAANSTIRQQPRQLWLNFTVPIRPTVSGVRLTLPDGRRVMLGPLAWVPHDLESVTAPLPQRLPPGRYLVEWSALDPNAHRTHGAFAFTLSR